MQHALNTRENVMGNALYRQPSTVDGSVQAIEVNIFNFAQDIYGQNLKVSFIKYLRGDVKFNDLESLKQQLQEDQKAVCKYSRNTMNTNPPRLLWSPSKDMKRIQTSVFCAMAENEKGLDFPDYEDLWFVGSTQNLEGVLGNALEYFNITFEGHYDQVLTGHSMPHCRWFEGARLN